MRHVLSLLTITLFCLAPIIEARTWTRADGSSFEGEYITSLGGLVRIRVGDENVRIRDSELSELDRQWVTAQEKLRAEAEAKENAKNTPAKPDTSPAPAPAASFELPEPLKSMANDLVDANGILFARNRLGSPTHTLVYYSASWCGPCRRFTPVLVEFHKQHHRTGRFEVVFISSDTSEKEMYAYMRNANMPWPALNYAKISNHPIRKYAGPGIPSLVVFNAEGKLVLNSYLGKKYVGPNFVLDQLKKRLSLR